MHQFLFIRLIGFYARALVLQDNGLSSKPLVIHRDKHVIDVNPLASDRQIYRGMALSEAKAILPEARYLAWEEEPYRGAQAEWLDICTEVSDVIEPSEQHCAWVDLSLHPGATGLAVSLVQKIEENLSRGIAGQALPLLAIPGLGGSKWIALLASQQPNGMTLQKPGEFLAPLRTRHLLPVEQAHRERLVFLGYETIGEVAGVPLNVLRSQFGEAATHIRMCARGGYFEPVEAIYPPNSIAERIGFEGSVEDLETLDNGLRALALALSQRLTQEDKQGKDVVLSLEHEEFKTTILRRKFAKPIQNFASALASLRLLLTPPPKEPIVGIRVRVENVVQSKRIQPELTGRTTTADRERGAMAAFQHIRTAFGDGVITTGDQLVEPRRKQVLRAWKNATGWT